MRLTPLLPPVNYGAVEKHTIFRSGFPQDRNVEFLEELGLNGMMYALSPRIDYHDADMP